MVMCILYCILVQVMMIIGTLDSTDRIPGADSYTFDGDTLFWKGIPRGITFECDE